MPFGANIAVIAPDAAFRHSLGFMLEVEGCQVALLESMAGLIEKIERLAGIANGGGIGFDCFVVDEEALTGEGPGLADLRRHDRPVILLVARIRSIPGASEAVLVEKPMLGGVLVDAVRTAVLAGQ